jgi:Uma2 family endonuclease
MSELITERPRLGKRPASRIPRPMTREKFLRWQPEDGYKYEWVNDQIEKTESAMTADQQYIVRNLQNRFMQTKGFLSGDRLVSETNSDMLDGGIRRPDVSLMKDIQFKEAAFKQPYTPAFAIEVISANDNINKVRQKLRAYFNSGVEVVWHIFPEIQTVDVYTSPTSVTVHEADSLCSAAPAVPDFGISVNEIFKI